MSIEDRISAVDNGLRHKVLIKNAANTKMNLLDRMQYYQVPGVSISVINKGVIEWSKAYGVVAFGQQFPITMNTLFQSGSISKLVTALGALSLVQAGKLSLDRDVNEYLKSWKIPQNEFTKFEKVTLRQLLSHSAGLTVSGFPGYPVGSKIPSLIEILDGEPPANTPPIRVDLVPGTKWRYSGGGTTIVQLLIEEVTGEKFDRWMANNILSKLNMPLSTFEQPLLTSKALTAACGHLFNGDKVTGNAHIYPEMAAAGLWSTTSDLATIILTIQKILTKQIEGFLSFDLINEMLTPQITIGGMESSGLGVFLQGKGVDLMFSHDGQDEGFSARLYGLARQEQGFVIMMNCHGNSWYLMNEITNSIIDVYGWPHLAATERTCMYFDPEQYNQFVGNYYSKNDEYMRHVVEKKEDKLFLIPEDMPPMELYPEDKYRFFTKECNQTIEFIKSKGNSIDGIIMTDDSSLCPGMRFFLLKE